MAIAKELLRNESDGSISFGDHTLAEKKKIEDFKHGGDLLKVKSFNEITRLEKNGLFLYESVPGTSVIGFIERENGVAFSVSGSEDAQITLGLKENTDYEVFVDSKLSGEIKAGVSGKLTIAVELTNSAATKIEVKEK